MNFSNKVIIVTGASSGIGAATAEYFAKYQASLSLIGRNLENLQKTQDNCKKINSNAKIFIIQADVTTDAEIIIQKTLEKYEKIDILINNAGILRYDSILKTNIEEFDMMLNVNLKSVFQLTKLVIPYLEKTKGNIVNVSSLAGLRPFPRFLSYCMTKAALDQLTKCTALELASKQIRVNSVNPGVIISDILINAGMNEKSYQEFLKHTKDTHAFGRNGKANEVASVIAFLASNEASFITGVCLPIDGGLGIMSPDGNSN